MNQPNLGKDRIYYNTLSYSIKSNFELVNNFDILVTYLHPNKAPFFAITIAAHNYSSTAWQRLLANKMSQILKIESNWKQRQNIVIIHPTTYIFVSIS